MIYMLFVSFDYQAQITVGVCPGHCTTIASQSTLFVVLNCLLFEDLKSYYVILCVYL